MIKTQTLKYISSSVFPIICAVGPFADESVLQSVSSNGLNILVLKFSRPIHLLTNVRLQNLPKHLLQFFQFLRRRISVRFFYDVPHNEGQHTDKII